MQERRAQGWTRREACDGSVDRPVVGEEEIGADELMFGGHQRPGGGELVMIFTINDRIGAGFAELGFLERPDMGGVRSLGDRAGEMRGDFMTVELTRWGLRISIRWATPAISSKLAS